MTRRDHERIRVRSDLVDAHRASVADRADIQRAYLRFSWARRKAPARLSLVRWLVAGVVIGVGVASAATLAPRLRIRAAAPIESAKVVGALSKPPRVAVASRSGAKAEPPPVAAAPESSAEPPVALPARSAVGAASVAVQRSVAPPSRASVTSASASDWERAAAALRGGDLSAAEAALADLEKSDNLLDRQAAELARAQLLVKRGRATEAASTLQRLARDGGSAVIRSQAASTLQTLGN